MNQHLIHSLAGSPDAFLPHYLSPAIMYLAVHALSLSFVLSLLLTWLRCNLMRLHKLIGWVLIDAVPHTRVREREREREEKRAPLTAAFRNLLALVTSLSLTGSPCPRTCSAVRFTTITATASLSHIRSQRWLSNVAVGRLFLLWRIKFLKDKPYQRFWCLHCPACTTSSSLSHSQLVQFPLLPFSPLSPSSADSWHSLVTFRLFLFCCRAFAPCCRIQREREQAVPRSSKKSSLFSSILFSLTDVRYRAANVSCFFYLSLAALSPFAVTQKAKTSAKELKCFGLSWVLSLSLSPLLVRW